MVSRRDFIKMAGAGAAALAAGAAGPFGGFTASAQSRRSAAAPLSPTEKVKVAFIGIGNRGKDNITEVMRAEMVDVVALCDVNMGAPHTQWAIAQFPGVPQYKDFRKMFDEMASKIEAVFVSTPDFSHFPISMRAVKEGIPRVYAYEMAAQSVLGSALMVLSSGTHPAALKDAVCSPGGTTIEAVEELERKGFRAAIMDAMDACARKSRELSKE